MNETLKSIFAVIGIVLIGFLIGYQTHKYTVHSRLERIAKERIEPGFEHRLLEILAVDEAQRQTLEPIMEKYGQKLIGLHQQMRVQRDPIVDSLRQEMKRHLDRDQIRRFERITQRMQQQDRRPRPSRKKELRRGKNKE